MQKRDEWSVGDRCMMKAGFYSRDGAATKLVPGTVVELLRGAATVRLDTGRECTTRLNQLMHDEAWLDEQEQREAEKKAKLERERQEPIVRLVSNDAAPQGLTHSLADKLRNVELPEVDDRVRQDALRQLEALRKQSAPPPPPEPEPVYEDEPEPAPEPAPEPEPAPIEVAPAPGKPAPSHPMQSMLERVQEQLLAVYDEHEQITKALARLPEVERKKKVLEAQERQIRAALGKLGML